MAYRRYPLIRSQLLNRNPNLVERFKRHVLIPEPTFGELNPHWIFQSNGEDKYGHLSTKLIDLRQRPVLAHRLSIALQFGEMPLELNACHLCEVKACCNPSHIHPGTQYFNKQEDSSRQKLGIAENEQIQGNFSPFRLWAGWKLPSHEETYQAFVAERDNDPFVRELEEDIRRDLNQLRRESGGGE